MVCEILFIISVICFIIWCIRHFFLDRSYYKGSPSIEIMGKRLRALRKSMNIGLISGLIMLILSILLLLIDLSL